MASSKLNRALITVGTVSPIMFCFQDIFFSMHKVHGASMEPALQDGDVVLVRKADFFTWRMISDEPLTFSELVEKSDVDKLDEQNDRRNLARINAMLGSRRGILWTRPCQPMKGDVILYKSPNHFHHSQLQMKRVIGLGGQRVRPADSFQKVETIPPSCVWIEGDNITDSIDSRSIGPISKKLIIGTVEYVIWPPSRWGAVKRERPPVGRAWWI